MSDQIYDAVIIGGGPAGLSAAVYTAREKMKTLVLDKGAFGGMAAITETIENYPGFSQGVGGQQLVDEMKAQAERFGATCSSFEEVTAIQSGDGICTVKTPESSYQARSVVITSGSTYRKLDVPGEEDLIGKGLHFCATCDAPLYKDKRVLVIGGGNSALQESLFIARFASSVHILVRGERFTGSEVLIEQVEAEPRISIQYNVAVESLARPETPGPIAIRFKADNEAQTLETDGVFVFIGLLPNNHPFEDCGLDDRGFIISDQHFRTQMRGVFVAGDVRSGSTWQIGSAVGEGVSAALAMRTYLDEAFPHWHKNKTPDLT